MGEQAFVLWKIVEKAFDGSSYLRCEQSAYRSYDSSLSASRLSFAIPWYSFPKKCQHRPIWKLEVSASTDHKDNSLNLPTTSETLTDLMHLLRADIVNCDDEDRLVPIPY